MKEGKPMTAAPSSFRLAPGRGRALPLQPYRRTARLTRPLLARLRVFGRDFERQLLGVADDVERGADAHALVREQAVQVVYPRDVAPVDADDDVALAQARARGGAARLDRDDEQARLRRQSVE